MHNFMIINCYHSMLSIYLFITNIIDICNINVDNRYFSIYPSNTWNGVSVHKLFFSNLIITGLWNVYIVCSANRYKFINLPILSIRIYINSSPVWYFCYINTSNINFRVRVRWIRYLYSSIYCRFLHYIIFINNDYFYRQSLFPCSRSALFLPTHYFIYHSQVRRIKVSNHKISHNLYSC